MKNQSIILTALLSAGAGLALGCLIWGHGFYMFNDKTGQYRMDNNETDHSMSGKHMMSDGSMMDNNESGMGMMGGMDHDEMMVKSDREFIEGMIPHHQEAVDTAKEVVTRGGTTPEIKKLVEGIVVAQEKEISMMKGWYQTWYGQPYKTKTDSYTPMMRDLSSLSGAPLDKVFLEDMIMHHMGAIMMAHSVQTHIEHQEISDLTDAIVETQMAEIKLMRQLLKSLQ